MPEYRRPSRPPRGRRSQRRPKPLRRFPPEVLTDDEVRALLAQCGPYVPTERRNAALIALLYRSGLRINEALELRPKDIDASQGAVRVLYGKGGSNRTSGIDGGAMAIVSEWLAARELLGLPVNAPLFCSACGRRLTASYVRLMLARLGRQAGIAKRVHAHGLRHTHATQLRAEGVDIGIISKQLGHRSISTTAHYLDHIAPYAVVDAVRARTW